MQFFCKKQRLEKSPSESFQNPNFAVNIFMGINDSPMGYIQMWQSWLICRVLVLRPKKYILDIAILHFMIRAASICAAGILCGNPHENRGCLCENPHRFVAEFANA